MFLKKIFKMNKNHKNYCTCLDENDTSCEITEPMEKKLDEYEEFLNCDTTRMTLPVYKTPFSEDDAVKMFSPSFKTSVKNNHISKRELLLGSVFGDIIGGPYEFLMSGGTVTLDEKEDVLKEENHFTDDTVMIMATLDALINNKRFDKAYKEHALKHPDVGYGGAFYTWINSDTTEPYGSFGNGSAMRISPCAVLNNDLEVVIRTAYRSAIVTHNHEEGIKGAVVVAVCIWFVRFGSIQDIEKYMMEQYGKEDYYYKFDLSFNEMVKKEKRMPVSCQSAVPFSIRCALDSTSYKDFMKNLIQAGHDVDTDGAIAGAVAAGLYGFPYPINETFLRSYLPEEYVRMILSIDAEKHNKKASSK